MTDTEFEILDELYFVSSYPELLRNTGLAEEQLIQSLSDLAEKGLVKCYFPDPDNAIEFDTKTFQDNFRNYYFLASKAGLLAHNSL